MNAMERRCIKSNLRRLFVMISALNAFSAVEMDDKVSNSHKLLFIQNKLGELEKEAKQVMDYVNQVT